MGDRSEMEVKIILGEDLQEDYLSWIAVKESLDIDRSINSFLHYIHYYGTFKNSKIPKDDE